MSHSFSIANNGIFEGIETLESDYMLVQFYSAKTTAMFRRKMQGAIDMLVENAKTVGFKFDVTSNNINK